MDDNSAFLLFYGGDIREGELPWLRTQIIELAAMPSIDEDGDSPAGMFLITDERGETVMWRPCHGSAHDS